MDVLIVLLFVLAVMTLIVTVVGHGIWLAVAWLFKQRAAERHRHPSLQRLGLSRCENCNSDLPESQTFCGRCGWRKPLGIVVELLKDLAAAGRQIDRFHSAGKLDEDTYINLKSQFEAERLRLNSGAAAPSQATPSVEKPIDSVKQHPISVTQPVADKTPPLTQPPASVVTASLIATEEEIIIERTPSFLPATDDYAAQTARPQTPKVTAPPPKRRSFPEVLNSFMEESNIRWGEIVGGLLIIGCSTALVVSLWSEISRIPVLKFLIFTTVTAALFSIGLYTEHRWKLPTTSRGILTIATLLVPLNFLAIAAVSGGAKSPGALVVGSELVAPAVFLCLVYFAGRVLTPSWPHLLVAGVLGSSIGQLLIRHFASPVLSPTLLLTLGTFPVACYVATALWMLKKALADREIDEKETVAIFITLGALTFAAVLPFGLLLYKTGPVGITMMYLAPLVSLGGFPLLATGTLLWQRITKKKLVASRTAGTSIAILGVVIVITGMILAWPNPASLVPAALFNFAVFTSLAIVLEIPAAHLLAAFCFGLAYLVLFHVIAGHIAWQNLRVTSLLRESLSVSSGQALAPLFLLFLAASEWLARKRNRSESRFYLVAACAVAAISLALMTGYGLWFAVEPYALWLVYGLYALGAFWIASRVGRIVFSWIGSALLLAAFAQALAQVFVVPFPWQTALLAHATVCAIAAIVSSRYESDAKAVLTEPLNRSALLTSFVAVLCVAQAAAWETTAMQAERGFWLAGIWLALLWLNRRYGLFAAFQIALTFAFVLTIKAVLQQYTWYAYLPDAFLHPWGLQIQGTSLVLLSLAWIAVRFAVKSDKLIKFVHRARVDDPHEKTSSQDPSGSSENWISAARRLLNSRWAFDRFVLWVVLAGFVLLAVYAALSGVMQELTPQGLDNPPWNLAGFPHQEALGIGSWILLGLLIIAMLANLWERRRSVYLFGTVVAFIVACPLLAGRFETDIATASAWRWLAALFLVIASLPLLFREKVFAWLKTFGWPKTDITGDEIAQRTRILIVVATLIPVLILTAYPATRAIYYMPVHGPASGFFHFLGDMVSYGVPLVLVALVLIGFAVRERLPSYAFAAGMFFNATGTMAYLLSVVAINGSMNRVVFAETIQINGITSAAYALVWLSMRTHWADRLIESQATTARRLLKLQVGIAIAFNVLLLAPVAAKLILAPELTGVGTIVAGSLLGWVAFVLAVVAAGWFGKAYRAPLRADAVCGFLIALGCLAAFTAARWESGNWTGLHTLMAASAVTAWLMWFVRLAPLRFAVAAASGSFIRIEKRWFAQDWERDTTLFATAIGAFTLLLALRAPFRDPTGSSWSVAILVAMSILAAALSWQTLKRGYLYAAGLILVTATLIWSLTHPHLKSLPYANLLEVNISVLCLSSIVWLLLELRARRLSAQAETDKSASFHNLAALLSLLAMSLLLWRGLAFDVAGLPSAYTATWTGWLALISLTALLSACVWDLHARYAIACLYLCGLLVAGMVLDQLNLPAPRLTWAGMIVMAIYTIASAFLWRSRATLLSWAERLNIPRRIDAGVTELKWLSAFNIALAAVIVLMAYRIDLTFLDATSRMTAALAVAAQAVTFGLLAQGVLRPRWERATIASLVIGAVFFGWACLVPGVTGTWLNRSVILMVEMFALTAVYGLGLNKALESEPDWTRAARDCIPWIAGAGVIALLFCLGTEIFYQVSFGAVLINPLALVAIGLTLVCAVIICVLFALSPKHDPFGLSERARMRYVYIAEMMLALVFLHIRLTMPWLFTGFFEEYWPFVVMAIAYLGVATSETLRRRKVLVLAQPIERTGAFLPLLPVLGFWIAQSKVDYSALLFVVGGVYGLLSILRRSFAFGLLAAIAGNGGLWYLLHRTPDYQFLQHPQLWLIPVGLSVLIAAYLNRDDFTEDQMAGIRYMSLVTIYASSTADIFINGVADSPWLPLILAALSLTGVFCGIIFRIRGLLLLGSVFLLLAIITMIWYASVNLGWTWLWYVAGIVTGATIIFMFALFEKKRSEVLRVVEGLKDWDR